MKEKHRVDNARALIRQRHPVALKMLADARKDAALLEKWGEEKKVKGVAIGGDFAMRGTSLEHVKQVIIGMIADETVKEVNDG